MEPFLKEIRNLPLYLALNYPLADTLVAVTAGLLVGMAGAPSGVAWAAVVLASALFAAGMLRARNGRSRQPLSVAALCMLFLGLGIFSWNASEPPEKLPSGAGTEFAYGRVEEVRLNTSNTRLLVSLEGFCDSVMQRHTSVDACRVLVYAKETECRPGDLILWNNRLEPAAVPAEVRAGVNGPYRAYLVSQGIGWRQSSDSTTVRVTGHRGSAALLAAELRDRAASAIETSGVKPATASMLKALLLGESDSLDPQVRQEFGRAGVAHILALSGQHLALLTMLLIMLTWPLALIMPPRWRLWVVIPAVWAFTFVTGCHVSVVRAAVMTTAMLAGTALSRGASPLNALCLAAAAILLTDGHALLDAGFQLSFICSAAIAVSAGPLQSRLRDLLYYGRGRSAATRFCLRLLYRFGLLVMIPVICFLSGWVVVLFHFGNLPALFLPANLLEAPVLTLFFTAAVVILPLDFLGLRIGLLNGLLDLLSDLLTDIPGLFSGFDAGGEFTAPGVITAVLYLLALAFTFMWLRSGHRAMLSAALSLMALTLIGAAILPGKDRRPALVVYASDYGTPRLSLSDAAGEETLTLSRVRLERVSAGGWDIVSAGRFAGDDPEVRSGARDGGSEPCDLLVVDARCETNPDVLLDRFAPGVAVTAAASDSIAQLWAAACRQRGIPIHRLSDGALRLRRPQ